MAVPRCVVFLAVVTLVTADVAPPVVQTSAGAVRGVHLASFSGRQYAAFRGIPYGSPPVGELRFSPPEPAAPWTHELDATRFGANCVQYDMTHSVAGDEDCLFLNVFSPRLPQTGDIGEVLPVLLWIHGGGFAMGSGDDDLHGMDYLMDEDVVVVSINYRLGVFGFYTTEDAVAPGNMGLRDQQLAMRWVQQNIGKFGGDRQRVTLFGVSAGGASVSLQVLSPLGAGTFQRAISQSGAATAGWCIGNPQLPLAKKLAEKFGCEGGDTSSWLSCLRRVDAAALQKTTIPFIEGISKIFHPRVDGSDSDAPVLPEEPNILLLRGNFNQVPRIIGQTSHEGVFAANFYRGDKELMQRLNDDDLEVWGTADLLAGGGIFDKTDEPLKVAAVIREKMLSDVGGDLQAALVALSDARLFTLSIESEANLTSLRVPVYKYVLDEAGPGQMSLLDFMPLEMLGNNMPKRNPPSHGDDLTYLFHGRAQKPVPKDSPKHRMIQIFTRLWTSFARLGYPSVEGLPAWPLFTERSKRHLRLNLAPSVGSHAFADTMRFWRSLPLKESWNAEQWATESAAGPAAHEEL